jgi:hypothetical protein
LRPVFGEDYRVLELRDNMAHSNIMDVISFDSYGGHRCKIGNRWTPTGGEMSVYEFSVFILNTSQEVISTILDSMKENPIHCLQVQ